MPVALLTIFVFFLDLSAVSGSLVVGYATAACALTFIVLRSDWDRLARLMEEMNNPGLEGAALDYLEDFDDESDSDSDGDKSIESDEDESPQEVREPSVHSKANGLRHRSNDNILG